MTEATDILPYGLCACTGAGVMLTVILLIWHCFKFESTKVSQLIKYSIALLLTKLHSHRILNYIISPTQRSGFCWAVQNWRILFTVFYTRDTMVTRGVIGFIGVMD